MILELCLYRKIFFAYFLFFLSEGLTKSPRLEYNGLITAHCNLNLLDSGDPPISVSWVAGTMGVCHHTWLIFAIFCIDGILLCHPGWCQTPGLMWSSHLGLPKCWGCRRELLCLALYFFILHEVEHSCMSAFQILSRWIVTWFLSVFVQPNR